MKKKTYPFFSRSIEKVIFNDLTFFKLQKVTRIYETDLRKITPVLEFAVKMFEEMDSTF